MVQDLHTIFFALLSLFIEIPQSSNFVPREAGPGSTKIKIVQALICKPNIPNLIEMHYIVSEVRYFRPFPKEITRMQNTYDS
jgi:hypothetical protein